MIFVFNSRWFLDPSSTFTLNFNPGNAVSVPLKVRYPKHYMNKIFRDRWGEKQLGKCTEDGFIAIIPYRFIYHYPVTPCHKSIR